MIMMTMKKVRYHLLAALLGATVGCADKEEGVGDGPATTLEIKSGCQSYCANARQCDMSVDVEKCIDECRMTVADCMIDEQTRTVEDLEDCGRETCEEFRRCTIGAGLQCTFGL